MSMPGLLRGLAWSVLVPALLLAGTGVLFVWSTTHAASQPLWGRQLAFLAVGALGALVVVRVGVRRIAEASWVIYLGLLALLAAMPWLADKSAGTRRPRNLPQRAPLVGVRAAHFVRKGAIRPGISAASLEAQPDGSARKPDGHEPVPGEQRADRERDSRHDFQWERRGVSRL